MTTKVAILGGTGNVGAALAENLVKHGVEVRLVARDTGKAEALAQKLGPKAKVASGKDAASWAELVILSVPTPSAEDAIEQAGGLVGKVVVDCTNPLTWNDGPVHAPPPEGSKTAQLAKRFPQVRFVKAFNAFGAEFHADPNVKGTPIDLYMAGDDAAAKETLAGLAKQIGYEPVDCGPLRNAAHLESLAILWIHLALRAGQGRNIAFKLLRR